MFNGFIRAYERINPPRTPEDSAWLRLSVLAAILIAELTVLAMGLYSIANAVGIPILTVAGFACSWKYRRDRNLLLKLILSLMVIAVAVLFARELAISFFDTRLPLIKLLMWLQVLHSFDLPARRDLKFSLASGLTLIAAGAVLSTGMLYMVGLALFSITAVVALVFFHISEESQRADHVLGNRSAHVAAYGALVWLAGIATAVPLLLIVPQSTQARLHTLPTSDLHSILGDFTPEVINPSYATGGNPFDQPPQFKSDSYYGFNPYMDLRSRGNLSDDIVMKVRSDGYDYYRGVVFDVYNGKGWEMSSDSSSDVSAASAPIMLNLSANPVVPVTSKIQSFYIETDLPNIIFASWKPDQLYFPTNQVKVDAFGSLRSPFQLTEGTVYSVISAQPLYTSTLLSNFPRAADQPAPPQYTSLPAGGDMDRVSRLAREIIAPYTNRYDQMMALQKYLKDNYTYDLSVPPQQRDGDAVSYFLFDEKRGYCEHFASAMAVMARSAGIPARVVTGYSGGSFNPFTGLWEIKQSDAHAWVEINFGAAGWVPFDPTPGFDTPGAKAQSQSPWLAGKIFSYLGDALGSGPAGSAFSAFGGAARGAVSLAMALPLLLTLAVILGAIALIEASRRLGRRFINERHRRRLVLGSLESAYTREEVLHDYLDLAMRLQKRGLIRRPEETLREFARRVSRRLDTSEFARLSLIVERLRYEEAELPDQSRVEAHKLAMRVSGILESGENGPSPVTGLS
ncbi:MAG: DUF3488 and transglutaminase-like domain-containing protein [Actinobacteria bacterium]|nr:DUF3488 and transglutaminase-like domain-containing protein [Actinomycetota bacterium]